MTATALGKLRAHEPHELPVLVTRRVRSALRTARFRLRHRRVTFGRGVQVRGRFRFSGPGRLIIGDGTKIDGLDVQTHAPDAVVRIGANCYVNHPELRAKQSIEIGDECILGSALIMDTDFHPIGRNRHDPREPVRSAPITIGRNVWLGARTAVLKGVTIGDDSVVSLGSVVRHDVPAGVIVAPPEAAVLRELPA